MSNKCRTDTKCSIQKTNLILLQKEADYLIAMEQKDKGWYNNRNVHFKKTCKHKIWI